MSALHYKPPEFIDELLGRYQRSTPYFKNVGTLLIGNNLLIKIEDAPEFVRKLFRLGYIISDVYFYNVQKEKEGYIVRHVVEINPDFENQSDDYYPTRQEILDMLSIDNIDDANYIEIIAGTLKVEY
jgi:hypothetical protein